MNIHPSKASLLYSPLHAAGREVKAGLHPPEAAGAALINGRNGGHDLPSRPIAPNDRLGARERQMVREPRITEKAQHSNTSYRSSHTSSMRQPLYWLLTMTVSPLSCGCIQVAKRGW